MLCQVYMKAREHKQTLKRVAYQASFAIVAPAVWYGSQVIQPFSPLYQRGVFQDETVALSAF